FNIFISYIYKILVIKTKNIISFNLNLKILKHIEKLPIEIFEMYNPTYLNQRVKGDCETIVGFWIDNIFTIIVNSFSIIFMLFLLYNVNISLFIIVLIFIPIYCIVYFIMHRKLYNKNLKAVEESNKYFGKLNDIYLRNKEIKVKVEFDSIDKELEKSFKDYFKYFFNYSKFLFVFNASDSIISLFFQSAVFFIGGSQVISKNMTIGEFTIMNTYFNMILNITKYYFSLGQTYQNVKVSVNRLNEILVLDLETNGNENINFIKKLKLIDINYLYKNKSTFFKNVSLNIDKPGIYAILGKNGAGKTTLVNTIIGVNNLGLKGKVLFNGINSTNINMYKLRKDNIAIMMQGEIIPSIFVKDYIFKYINKEIFDKNLNYSEFKSIFVSELFDIYKILDKKIDKLSSGEKQMVSLLITLFKKADLYILDEPTSNIHNELSELVINFLEKFKKDKIIIIISHDDKMKYIFDKEIVLSIDQKTLNF
ncbi:ABC transporter ATP-binding protein, partial [Clostridium sp. Sa3CUN1]